MCLLNYDFFTEYDISLSAWGSGILTESALLEMQRPESILASFEEESSKKPKSVSLSIDDPTAVGYDFYFEGIDSALLEKLPCLKELILPATIKELVMTPALEKILKSNNTLIRGSFDSFAERFAKENSLRFRPADYKFAVSVFEPASESTELSLVFKRNGRVEIKEDIRSPGSSAGNTFGGIFYHKIPKNFYEKSVEKIASVFKGAVHDEIIKDGRLADFMEKAKTHEYYSGRN